MTSMADTVPVPVQGDAPQLDAYAFASMLNERARVLRGPNQRVEDARQVLRAIDHDHKVAVTRIGNRLLRQARQVGGQWAPTTGDPADAARGVHAVLTGVLDGTAELFLDAVHRLNGEWVAWQVRRGPVLAQIRRLETERDRAASALPAMGGTR